ncbi:MAG: CynX/NimT family MFS transporter [Coprobacillaceae bacterium]
MNKKDLKYMILIFLVAFNLRIGISSVPPIIGMIKETLNLNNFQASLLTSIPVICMGSLAFFVGKLQEKLGRNKTICICLLILSIGTISRIYLNSYIGLLFTTIVIGFSIAIIGPLISGFIKEEFSEKSGLLIGIYSLSMGIGSSISSAYTLSITNAFNNNWSLALSIWGAIPLLVACIWQFFSPKEVNKSKNKKKQSFPLKSMQAWKMVLFFGIQSGIFYGFTTWIADLASHLGYSSSESAYMLTIFTIVQMSFSFIIPTLMDKVGTTKLWIFICSGLVLIGNITLLILPQSFFIFSLLIVGVGAGGLFPIAMLLPLKATSNALEASLWTGMVQSFGYILGGIIPIIMGIVNDITKVQTNAFIVIIILCIILIVIAFSRLEKK